MRSPCTAMKSSLHSPQLEKAQEQQRRLSATKKEINKGKKKKGALPPRQMQPRRVTKLGKWSRLAFGPSISRVPSGSPQLYNPTLGLLSSELPHAASSSSWLPSPLPTWLWIWLKVMVFRFVPEAHWRKRSSTELNPRSSPGPGIRHVWVGSPTLSPRASLAAQMVKNLPAMQETRVQSLGWKDSPGGGHSNPLQYSCLENPVDGGA